MVRPPIIGVCPEKQLSARRKNDKKHPYTGFDAEKEEGDAHKSDKKY